MLVVLFRGKGVIFEFLMVLTLTQMASSLDNHPTLDGFCVRSSDTEVLVMEEY